MGVLQSNFNGYEELKLSSIVVGLLSGGEIVKTVSKGDEVDVILKETPFYGEMGGQVGDTGEIRGDGGRITVSDTLKPLAELTVHRGRVVEGRLSVGDSVEVEVDEERRLDIARNHTATHLLQTAFRQVSGSHVQQKGSLVTPGRLRFDFSHLGTVDRAQLREVEDMVNDKIRQNLVVGCEVLSYDEAVARGAIALFGEKYGETVRVVSIGVPLHSIELCGGTHVTSTGEIGFFYIMSEGSIGSGLRRIEAVTGRGALEFVKNRLLSLESIAGDLKTTSEEAIGKVRALISELDVERKRVAGLQRQLSGKTSESLVEKIEMIDGVKVLSAKISVIGIDAMREMGDMLKGKLGSGVVVLGANFNERPNFLAMVTPDIVSKGVHAGKLVKQIAMVTGGGGGGKPELGQAGGKDKGKIDQALSMVGEIVKQALE